MSDEINNTTESSIWDEVDETPKAEAEPEVVAPEAEPEATAEAEVAEATVETEAPEEPEECRGGAGGSGVDGPSIGAIGAMRRSPKQAEAGFPLPVSCPRGRRGSRG